MIPSAARDQQKVADSVRFACPYCCGQNEVAPALAGCVAACPHCTRDVLAPLHVDCREPPIDAKLVRTPVKMLAVLLAGVLGTLVGSLLLFVPVWSSMLNPIGLGAGFAAAAGLIGGLLGAFFSGLLANWLWPEPHLVATKGVGKPLMVRSIVISACVGSLAGGLLLFLPVWFCTLNTIGIGMRHAMVAGLLGALLGAFLGGLFGYCMCQE